MGMLSKKKPVALDEQVISTLIAEGCVIDGNFKGTAFVRIEGQITGDVIIDEGLILGEKGLITGTITTKEMIVYGSVNGNIKAQSLEIKSTGKITGDIITQSLQVETGGFYTGHLSMPKNQ